MLYVGNQPIKGSEVSLRRKTDDSGQVVPEDTFIRSAYELMLAADAIVVGTPTYYTSPTPECLALMQRACQAASANGKLFNGKVGAAVVAERRAGAVNIFDTLQHFFHISQMYSAGASYWNMVLGKEAGECKDDAEGMENMRTLGVNIATLLKKLNA